ncbi:MAG TPA: hypothetical protein ENN80_06130, partial [Candidatus Hydrogenedentes bacterium]|nr:hypothetical protein [Candidatus Hydrogenedentota bacterium]
MTCRSVHAGGPTFEEIALHGRHANASMDPRQAGEKGNMVDLKAVRSSAEWPAVRERIQEAVAAVLQDMPKERVDLQVKTVDELQFPGYVRRRVNYFVDEWERVTAWLFVPDGREEVPAILCCHRATPLGKDECAGIEGNPAQAFAHRYAEKGFVTIAPDCITAGSRVSSGLEPLDTKAFYRDHPKMSLMGKMLADHMCAIDALCETRNVDAARIGVIGHGLGAQNALLLAAWDERIQACIASCGFTRFADDPDPARWARPNGFVQFPKLSKAISERAFPFDWEHILALIAPSPTLLLTALNDGDFPHTRSCSKAAKMACRVYTLLGAA